MKMLTLNAHCFRLQYNSRNDCVEGAAAESSFRDSSVAAPRPPHVFKIISFQGHY